MTNNKNNLRTWETPYRENGCKESAVAFQMFTEYLNMGVKRNLTKLAKKHNIPYATARQWSYKYKWEDRINKKLENDIKENKELNDKIKLQEINAINHRLNMKGKLLNTVFEVLIRNVNKFKNEDLDFKDFVKFLNIAAKIENITISDLTQLKELEKMILENTEKETGEINSIVNNFNMLLAENNQDAINDYIESVRKESF